MVLPVNTMSGVEALGVMAGANAQQAGLIETFSKVRQREASADQSRASADSIRTETKDFNSVEAIKQRATDRKVQIMKDEALLEQQGAYERSLQSELKMASAQNAAKMTNAEMEAEFNIFSGVRDQNTYEAAVQEAVDAGISEPGDYPEAFDPAYVRTMNQSLAENYQLRQQVGVMVEQDKLGRAAYAEKHGFKLDEMSVDQRNQLDRDYMNFRYKQALQQQEFKYQQELLVGKATAKGRGEFQPYKDLDYDTDPAKQSMRARTSISGVFSARGIEFNTQDVADESVDELVTTTLTNANNMFATINMGYKNGDPAHPNPITYDQALARSANLAVDTGRVVEDGVISGGDVLSVEEGAQRVGEQRALQQAASDVIATERAEQQAKVDAAQAEDEAVTTRMMSDVQGLSGQPTERAAQIAVIASEDPIQAMDIIYPAEDMSIPGGRTVPQEKRSEVRGRRYRKGLMQQELRSRRGVGRKTVKKTPEERSAIAKKYATYEIIADSILTGANRSEFLALDKENQQEYIEALY